MLRLPRFRYHAPRSAAEAATILAAEGPQATLLAGGTDLLPNMKRRQQTPAVLVGLRQASELRETHNGEELRIGAAVTLAELVADARLRERYTGLHRAAAQVATSHLRNMATLGGNLCLDTRCDYYDQTLEWRRAIDFCMKKDGRTCWVAPASRRCLAVSSTDAAPALIALGARIRLVSDQDERVVSLDEFYRDDGIRYCRRRPDEILTDVLLEPAGGRRSTYWKLRRRGAFDFPVLSVAAALRLGTGDVVEEARIVLGAVASRPLLAEDAAASLIGKPLDDDAIEAAAGLAARRAKPMDNTDFTLHWRKRVARQLVANALRELRGDDVAGERRRLAKQSF